MRAVSRWSAIVTAIGGSLAASCALATGFTEADVIALAQQELHTALQGHYSHVTDFGLTPIARAAHGKLPPEDSTPRVDVLSVGARSAVRVSWRESDQSERSRTIWFDVTGKAPVFVAARDFSIRQGIDKADVQSSELDPFRLRCAPIRSMDEVAGMRTTHAVRQGAPICKDGIEIEPPVARGDNVTVRYESERVSLTSKAVAQQDGRLGETLRVVNPATKDSFVAIVSGSHEVMVHE